MRKVNAVAQVIQKRLSHGDHRLGGLPSERRLAEELGISRTTVRSAVRMLVKDGVLARQENGRLEVGCNNPAREEKVVGFAMPVGNSLDHAMWREAAEQILETHGLTLRVMSYTHWGDQVLADAINALDGLFFIPLAESAPAWLKEKMGDAACRVAVVDQDWGQVGLPSVAMFPQHAPRKLFEHLAGLGHRRIDCVNTQSDDDVGIGRVAAWREYIEENSLGGEYLSLVGRWLAPAEAGYRLLREALAQGRPVGSALFCTTGITAIGVMRALHESGLEVGRDVSVCAVNGEGLGPYLLKSLTTLESPSRVKYLRQVADWMLGEQDWRGPLLIRPDDVTLCVGESTGPKSPPRPTRVLKRSSERRIAKVDVARPLVGPKIK